jgi:hypothetical protein
MRYLIALVISFELMAAPVAPSLGEKSNNKVGSLLTDSLASAVAEDFDQQFRTNLQSIQNRGLEHFIKNNELGLEPQDKEYFDKIKIHLLSMPQFVEVEKGRWEAKVKEHKVSFSLKGLYQDTVEVNGVPLNFTNKNLNQLQKEIETILTNSKTTHSTSWWKNLSIISEAQAALPFVFLAILAGVVFVAVSAKRAYAKYVSQPRQTSSTFTQLTSELNAKANRCEQASSNRIAYSATFGLASSLGESSSLLKAVSPSEALKSMLKHEVSMESANDDDCFKGIAQAGERLHLSVPNIDSESFRNRRRILSDPDMGYLNTVNNDNSSDSLIVLCNTFNRLSHCMNSFVEGHVNHTEASQFKETATENFERFKRRMATKE